jgi:prevent-host-death family protein
MMLGTWPLQDAKARLSELVRMAMESGPQRISLRGEPAVVVLSEHDFQVLASNAPTLVDHILGGDLWSDDVVEAINDRQGGSERNIVF